MKKQRFKRLFAEGGPIDGQSPMPDPQTLRGQAEQDQIAADKKAKAQRYQQELAQIQASGKYKTPTYTGADPSNPNKAVDLNTEMDSNPQPGDVVDNPNAPMDLSGYAEGGEVANESEEDPDDDNTPESMISSADKDTVSNWVKDPDAAQKMKMAAIDKMSQDSQKMGGMSDDDLAKYLANGAMGMGSIESVGARALEDAAPAVSPAFQKLKQFMGKSPTADTATPEAIQTLKNAVNDSAERLGAQHPDTIRLQGKYNSAMDRAKLLGLK